MPGLTTSSADGTTIAYDRSGDGPLVVLVHGAFTDRTHATMREVAGALSPWFTVVNYDRRGRGDSGDTPPYSAEREIEDLAAVITSGGGSAMVFGGSSGAALALRAAAAGLPITKLALWEPPYHVDPSAPDLPLDFAEQLTELVARGHRGETVSRFMSEAAEVPPDMLDLMRESPMWPGMEALAHTLAYEAAVLGPGNRLPAFPISLPALVLNGELSPGWMRKAGEAVAAALPYCVHRTLDGQAHDVSARALSLELLEFFTAR